MNDTSPPLLQSYIAGRWIGREPAQTLRSAVNGRPVARTHADSLDFAEALDQARDKAQFDAISYAPADAQRIGTEQQGIERAFQAARTRWGSSWPAPTTGR